MRVLVGETIQQDLWLASRFVFARLDGDEHQVRSGSHPDPVKTDFKSADEIESFHEDSSLIEFAIAIGIFKNQNPILSAAFSRATRISVSLGHPQSAAVVHGECY